MKLTDAEKEADDDKLFREEQEDAEPAATTEPDAPPAADTGEPQEKAGEEYSVESKADKPKIVIKAAEEDETEEEAVEEKKAKPVKKPKAVPLSDDYVVQKLPEDLYTNPPVFILNSRETFIRETNKALAKQFKHLEESETTTVSCDLQAKVNLICLHIKKLKFYLNVFSPIGVYYFIMV